MKESKKKEDGTPMEQLRVISNRVKLGWTEK